ncbi:MAG: replication initiator protein [Microvirus sp.]|nr:MAG: replication initiator protein [Microvirus sp.]
MPCYHPLVAWKSRDLSDTNQKTGKTKMVFSEAIGLKSTKIELPCGQCIGCRLDRARAWAVRCLHEASLHENNCFLTLTYSDDQLPENGSLNKRDIVLFLKRLRKKHSDISIRFFQCGEYGEQFKRPHHHVLLFGYDFPDKAYFKKQGDYMLYLSQELADLWPHGLHSIGNITFDSACYCARYILKKVTGKPAKEHYGGTIPEYVTMSRKPGIGKAWYDLYHYDLFNHDKCVVGPDFICRPPKYYDKLFDLANPDRFKQIKTQRLQNALNNPDNNDDRRRVKEQIQNINQEKLLRTYEQPIIPLANSTAEYSAEWRAQARP